MLFKTIVHIMEEQATKTGMPVLFGDCDCINEQVNQVSGMFLSFDVTGGDGSNKPPATSVYTVIIRCMDQSFYMEDNLRELQVLIDTDIQLRSILSEVVCKLEVMNVSFRKVQNEYDTKKSGWEATLRLTDSQVGINE